MKQKWDSVSKEINFGPGRIIMDFLGPYYA